MRWRVLSPFLLGFAWVVLPVVAQAKLCGDDVNGQDVPCACGDTVVSSVVLADDPIVSQPCAADGLIVRALGASHGVTIDLAGKTLRGKGHGTGIWVVYGGPGGARLVSSGQTATLDGFRDGVIGSGSDSIHLVQGVRARRSARDGFRLHTDFYEVRNAEAILSGRDGFSVSGAGFIISGSLAQNSTRHGYLVMGVDANVGLPGAGDTAEGNGADGFHILGAGHSLVDCISQENGKNGVNLGEVNYEVKGCTAQNNGEDGIKGSGMNWQLSRNRALNNNNDGLVVRGSGVEDAGGNEGSGNQGALDRRPGVQCRINGAPCRQ